LTAQLRISFAVGNLSDGGGVNRVVSDLSALFAERLGAEVEVIGVGTTGEPTYPISPRVKLETGSNGRPITWREALRRLRRNKPDFVIGSWTQSNCILILGLLLSGVRVIVFEHTSWYFHPRRIRALRWLIYPLAWRVIVLNPSELAHYRRFLGNARLLPDPVPAVPGPRAAQREKLIVAVGHLEPRKNFIDAIEAMALSGLEDEGWSLAIIGDGPDEPMLRDAIGRAGLERTTIHPPTSDLASWYNRASLTLVTARLEVFSLVLAEAMSAGVVPIAYATDGPSFILGDFPEHLVPIGDVKAMAAAMRRFAEGGSLAPLRSSLASSVDNRFSPKEIAECWKELLGQIGASSSKPSGTTEDT
jgi:glycosyltransferase involved in cell wall biosynthesis